ncbi:MAG: hypothetical protein IJU02_03265 [Lachnospiraceae bacterium]|nr:hypothetical protein [Lachnospiraceae bacterium]
MSAKYQSNALIGMVSNHMRPYRFSEEDAKEVGMFPEDTGVIVLLILYFIEKEPTISRSKLEYYILLLDRMCFEQRGVLLFSWKLKGGRILNFIKFIDFMIEKKLISHKSSRAFELQETGSALGTYYAELSNIIHWLEEILRKYKQKTAEKTKADVVFAKCDSKYMTALSNVKQVIKANTTKGA